MALNSPIRSETGMLPEPYMRVIARQYGVPSAWEDDAVQEMRLGIWRAGVLRPRDQKVVAKRRTVDFLRVLGGRGARRRGVYGDLSLDADVIQGPRQDLGIRDRIMDLNAALDRLTPTQRETFRATVAGDPLPLTSSRRHQLRRILREATA